MSTKKDQESPRVTSVNRKEQTGARFSGSIPCRFCCPEGFFSGVAKNLSIDGAFIASDASPPQGSIGNLVFTSEGVVRLKVPSRVVHAEESSQLEGFGLHFLYFGEDSLELLEALASE